MIYLCQYCGWRINQRYNNPNIDPEDIGKYIFYNHMTFCNEYCVEFAKKYPPSLRQYKQASDWNENRTDGGWKVERKLTRPKRIKRY